MFNFNIGRNIADGALKRLGERFQSFDLEEFAGGVPALGIILRGYNAMTEEEQTLFAKNLLLAGAAIAAKGGR